MQGKTLAIGAHPDDVELGCGGTLHKLSQSPMFLILCSEHDLRIKEQRDAVRMFDGDVYFGDLNKSYRENVEQVETLIHSGVENVYLHWKEDTHQDHRNVCDIAFSALRRFKGNIFLFETPSSLNFHPNVFVDISNHFRAKVKSVECHVSQNKKAYIRNWMEKTAVYRGMQRGTCYAEGFVAYKVMR